MGNNGGTSGKAKSASHFSDKQIAHTVKDSQAIEVTLPSGDSVVGWVYGMDAYHWGVIDQAGVCHVLHKTGASFRIHDLVIEDLPEDRSKVIEATTRSFRAYVMRTFFNCQPAAAS